LVDIRNPVSAARETIENFRYLYLTMRKLSAFILLIPIAILFFGSMTLSSLCPITPTCTRTPDECCHRQTGKSSCAKEQQSDRSKKQQGDRPKDQKSDRPRDQKSDRPACCFDCPLCALVTNPPFILFEPTHPEITTEYAVRPDNLLTDYYQHHWKPPDTTHLS
jgi:hypothetical protein